MSSKMGLQRFFSRAVVILTALLPSGQQQGPIHEENMPVTSYRVHRSELSENQEVQRLHRSSFPEGFVFGTASSAYQYEGAANEGGRGPSVWDTSSHIPGYTADGSNGDVAVDQYHRYKDDIDLMTDMGLDAYRFSISWSRIFPDGLGPEVNEEGVAYYNDLIDALLAKGLQSYVTLYHWDMPQSLENLYGGWLGSSIVPAFEAYAEVCFEAFGDRVKHWITFNEAHGFAIDQTNQGCKNASGDCGSGQPDAEPYLVGHHVLLAHAAAVKLYRLKFQAEQGGSIGITCDAQWFEPLSNSASDMEASTRMQLFQTGWFLDPIFFGDYPEVMKTRLGSRLPVFSESESLDIKGSADFVGINHYTTYYVTDRSPGSPAPSYFEQYAKDPEVILQLMRDGVQIGAQGASGWLYVVPWGIQRIVHWVKTRYNNPPMYITENGMDEKYNASKPLDEVLYDTTRIQYYNDYLKQLLAEVRDGANVRGYFAWSLLDNFEWSYGYTVRFGLYLVDIGNDLARIPKASAFWFKDFLHQWPTEYSGVKNVQLQTGRKEILHPLNR